MEARGWYQKAGAIFSSLRDRGTLMPTDADKPKELSDPSAECARAIEQLTAANGSR
jgi:hypothetical protein